MAGQRQPTALVLLMGKKHITKAETEERLKNEITAPDNNISPPEYLTKSQRKKFAEIAAELTSIGIMSNLDCDALANYVIALDNYARFTRLVRKTAASADKICLLEKAVNMQDKAFKQCRSAASDLGLTISSRCKLVVPKKEEPPKSKWDAYKSG